MESFWRSLCERVNSVRGYNISALENLKCRRNTPDPAAANFAFVYLARGYDCDFKPPHIHHRRVGLLSFSGDRQDDIKPIRTNLHRTFGVLLSKVPIKENTNSCSHLQDLLGRVLVYKRV